MIVTSIEIERLWGRLTKAVAKDPFIVVTLDEAKVMIAGYATKNPTPAFQPIFPGSPFSYVRLRKQDGNFDYWTHFLIELSETL